MIKDSFIYNGTVIHKRFKPKEHFFKYKVFSLFLNLKDLSQIDKKINFFSYNKFNLLSFYDKDHGDRDGSSLVKWVKKNSIKFGKQVWIRLPKSKFIHHTQNAGKTIQNKMTEQSYDDNTKLCLQISSKHSRSKKKSKI